jgi:CMP-N-acetylneuraminic acid synthetase
MNNLAVIPARGGSKRLPRKNVLPIGGRPLVRWTLDAAVASGVFSTVILSSDDDEILAVGADVQGVVCEKRPCELAGDAVKVIDLIKDIAARRGYDEVYDTISLLLPTCPFRTAEDIRGAFALLKPEIYGVVSIAPMVSAPQLSTALDEEGCLVPDALLHPSPLVTGMTRSQDFRPYYVVNGGIYTAWIKKFRIRDNFFQGVVKGYVMSALHSIDIDLEHELEIARHLVEKGYIQ